MKDIHIYIRIRTEILYQMINDDLNLYFYMKKGKVVVNRFHIEERIEYSLIKAFTTQSDSSFAELINRTRIKIESHSTCQYRQQ